MSAAYERQCKMSFIEIKYGIVRKEDISGLIRTRGQYPWNGETHYDIEVHLQGTKVCLEFDSEVERSTEFNRIADELKKKD